MKITVNSETREFADGLTAGGLLEQLNLTGRYVAVERNGKIVSYRDFDRTTLEDGDVIEVVTLVGGG